MSEHLELWDYRRRVADMYRQAREGGGGEASWQRWRDARDDLFATHPQSPIPAGRRPGFTGLPFWPYDPAWRVEASVEPLDATSHALGHSGGGSTPFVAFAVVGFTLPTGRAQLTLYWLDSYGGGVFLPFRDTTNGDLTYGGGRYLVDTAKGADLGHRGNRVALDFNYAYHPSCVYDDRWSCPLAPPSNRLNLPVEAGERLGT